MAGFYLDSLASAPASGVVMGSGETIAHVVASSLVGGTGEKIALTTGAQGKAHVFTVGAGEFWAVDFFAFKVDAGTIGESNLKIVRYDQGFSSSADDSTVLAEHTYSGGEVAAANNDYLYYEFDPIVLTGGQHGTTYALAFSNAATSVELKAYFDTSDAYADGFLARNFYPDLSGSTRDFNFAMGNSGAVDLSEVVFAADFDASTAISGSVSANASEANLNAGTAVGSWALPDVNPGALISDGGSNNALMFDRVTSGSISNTVNAVFSRGVDLAGGEALVLEMDLYAARQANGQRIYFMLEDAAGNRAYECSFRMNNNKDFFTVNSSGQITGATVNGTGVNNGFKNPAVDGYLNWGATMIRVKIEVGSQPSQAGNRGATLSIDWNGDGDFLDGGELVDADFGARSSGVSEIGTLRLANDPSVSGGAWIDNISVTAKPGSVFAHPNHFNLAKYQAAASDSQNSATPKQFATDGMVARDSRWITPSGGPHWLELALAAPMTVGSAHLFSGAQDGYAMADFSLQYHDGAGWVDIPGAVFAGNASIDLNMAFDAPVTAQRFRLYTTDSVARVKDLALYPPTADGSMVPFGTDLDLNLAKLRQVEASSISGANYPKLAVDGYADDASCWVGDAGTQELEISWLQAENIRGIHLYSGWEGQPGTQIQNFKVEYWNGTAWVAFAGGAIAGNTRLERDVRFDVAVTTSKIRIQTLDAGAPRIRELVVLPENFESGYPLWTDVKDEAPPTENFLDYDDGYHAVENRATGQDLNADGFQILLNIGTDTYRLRSKASGDCLEVALASLAEGAPVVEGTYSSMPHQKWRLVDSGDGTHFRIVNVWSGKALEVVDNAAVQKGITSDASQEWAFNYQTHVPKKGQVAFFHYNDMYRPNWFYSWSATAENDCEYGDYHPMQWGWLTSDTPVILRDQPKWYARSQVTCAMGFNEPDKSEQSNIPEEDAADQWPRLERMQLPLVGPCPAQSNGSWRQNYEAMAAERGLRSEYMALHWYAGCNGGSPQNIINVINSLYSAYGKPIWITEFAVKDWSGTSTGWNRNDNFNWLAEFLWRAEGIAHLKKYSLFEWGTEDNNDDPTVNDAPTMGLHVRNDKTDPGWEDLSECGLLLAGWDGDTTIRDTTAYIIHNKGRSLRLIDHPASNTVTHANILHRIATDQFMLQSAPGGKKYIVGINDGRRLHYNGSSVGLSAAGTTGSAVEWALQENQHGWFFINHPSTGKRLRITNSNVIDVDANTNTADNLQFRFIKPARPISLAEVQPLPYAESFEHGFGGWRQSLADDYDWTRNSGGTPTASAGPSGASDGDYYLYAEGHDAGSYKTTSVQCVFDLSAVSFAELTFDYHMFGIYIDFLSVDVHDGSTWTSNVWTRSGQQHASSESAWANAVVDLADYAGNAAVTIRFRTKNTLWNSADPAIDNIRLEGGVLSVYDQWALDAFEGAPIGTDTSANGNPDGDPNSNELEWIFATDPLAADSPVTALSFSDPNLVITYTRRKVDGISVYAEWAPELDATTWETTGFLEVVIGDDGEVETVAVLIETDQDKKYVRLQVAH